MVEMMVELIRKESLMVHMKVEKMLWAVPFRPMSVVEIQTVEAKETRTVVQ